MSAASDRARFYLERSVPELQSYAQHSIFSPTEITSIAKKRSDFEHILNSNTSTPRDYIRYATYEMNLDSLRKKRCKRLGVKGTQFSGQRNVFFIFDRAVKKFPGERGIWGEYIRFCQAQRANKKLAKVFTAVLRLRPRDVGMWMLAAKYYAEVQGDMGTARSYMQRGLRFCKDERKLYLEYAKLEMVYLAKLAARKRILGLDGREEKTEVQESEDVIALPEVTAEDLDMDAMKGVEEVDVKALQRLADAPAYTGAIPVAIFDAAMKQFGNDSAFAADFFDLVAIFDSVPSAKKVLQHIYEYTQMIAPGSADFIVCEAILHTFGTAVTSADFASALSASLGVLKRGVAQARSEERARLGERAMLYLTNCLQANEELDEAVQLVLKASIMRYGRLVKESANGGQQRLALLIEKLEQDGKHVAGELVRSIVGSDVAV